MVDSGKDCGKDKKKIDRKIDICDSGKTFHIHVETFSPFPIYHV